ncbi:MAG: asparaginase [Pseudoruegeria sp.]
MAEVWRGPFLESVHSGHAVVCDHLGNIVRAWGDPDQIILPRSSAKIIQALPLIESGAAKAFGLKQSHIALAGASHSGADIHTKPVRAWLTHIGKSEADLLCGPETPRDRDARAAMIRAYGEPHRCDNNCSGKHAGFLTYCAHNKTQEEYTSADHVLQKEILAAFEDLTGATSAGFGIDGCSAPNYATTVHGLAKAMGYCAAAREDGSTTRERAAASLVQAMVTYPELLAGETRACTELMRAMDGKVAVKTGAEGVYIAILPERKLGVALKIIDGTTRASECAIAAILVGLGVLNPEHPATLRRMNKPILNVAGLTCGEIRPAATLLAQ